MFLSMKVLEALKWASEKLKNNFDKVELTSERLDSPMLDAEILLAAAVGQNKSWLFTHLDYKLREHESEIFQDFIKRRGEREPVAYITEQKEFYKRIFKVNRFVLIPRPETEILIEKAIDISKKGNIEKTMFADIGTGSGAIAVTLAAETNLPVIATDISKTALTIAKSNTGTLSVDELVDVRQGNLLAPVVAIFKKLGNQTPFEHLIICANLPYITESQWEHGQKELHFEPKLALTAGHDGLEAYWELFRQLSKYRKLFPEKISVLIEIDPSQRNLIKTLITHDFPNADIDVVKDLAEKERVVILEI